MPKAPALDANWTKGISSIMMPELIEDGEYSWLLNGDNQGGIITTRQGFNMIGTPDEPLPEAKAKGLEIFKDRNGGISMFAAVGDTIWATPFPFTSQFLPLYRHFPGVQQVSFCKAFVSMKIVPPVPPAVQPTYQVVDPYPILVIQDGVQRPLYYDGQFFFVSSDNGILPGIPIGKYMAWVGGRLWVSDGAFLHASDPGCPLSFYEETSTNLAGLLSFDNDITGLAKTPDQRNLLVGTDFDMSSVAAGVLHRSDWGSTPNFQNVFLPGGWRGVP